MNRYKSSSKFNKNFDNDIIFQDDFDNQLQHKYQNDPQINNNPRYKSIPSKAALFHNLQQTLEKINPNNVEELNIIKREPSSQEIRMDNFFGSKKTLQRKINNSNSNLSSDYNPQARQRRQIRNSVQEDTNDKLKEMIQKQIQARQRWQNIAQQKQKSQRQQYPKNEQDQNDNEEDPNFQTIESTDNAISGTNPLLVINNQESFQRMNSKQKLTKINEQKFAANNLQKNPLFERNNNQDGQYIDAVIQTEQKKQQKEVQAVQQKKKKRAVSQLKPLKKKQPTYEVLNQLDMVSRPSESQLISINENNSSLSTFPIKKLSPKTSPHKNSNFPKTRLIGIDIKNFLSFAFTTLSKDKYLEGTLHRDRKCFNKAFFPQYSIQIDEVNALLAKKTMKGYDIYQGNQSNNVPFEKMQKIGSVKGNFLGSYYNIYRGKKQDQIIATIFYSSQNSKNSAVRSVQLYVRSSEISIDQIDYGMVYDRTTNLKTLYNMSQNNGKFKKYISKQPLYNSQTGSYQLDFGTNKVSMPSVKNVVLINAQNPKQKVLVFGKSGYDNFYLRVENPLSPIIALGYLMTSFNFKWVSQ